MDFVYLDLKVDPHTINTALSCNIRLEFNRYVELPLHISGRLKLRGKTIGNLFEKGNNHRNSYSLKILSEEQKLELRIRNNVETYYTEFSVELSTKAIEAIERYRECDPRKGVKFDIELLVKTLEIPSSIEELGSSDFNKLTIQNLYRSFSVEESSWLRDYTEELGIGKYFLIDIIVDKHELPDEWSTMFNNATQFVTNMENSIQRGDWQNTMYNARQFFESIKLGDTREANSSFKLEFEKKMESLQHSSDGINNLYLAIKNLFDYTSKFIHNKDRKGKVIEKLPIPQKADAYLAYTLSVNLLNVIGSKLK